MASRAERVEHSGLWRETVKAGAVRGGALAGAVLLLALAVAIALALASYHRGDDALNTVSGSTPGNLLGTPGAWFADIALMLLGPAVALALPVVPIVGIRLWHGAPVGAWGRMARNVLAGVALGAIALILLALT